MEDQSLEALEFLKQASEFDKYHTAEKELCAWVDKYTSAGLSMFHIVFLLQFRVYDINRLATVPMENEDGSN